MEIIQQRKKLLTRYLRFIRMLQNTMRMKMTSFSYISILVTFCLLCWYVVVYK